MSLDANQDNFASSTAPRLLDVVTSHSNADSGLQNETKEGSSKATSESKETNLPKENKDEIKSPTTQPSTINSNQNDTKSDTNSASTITPNEEGNATSTIRNSNNTSTNGSETAPVFSVASLITNNSTSSNNPNNQAKVTRTTIIRHQSQPLQPSQPSPVISRRSISIAANTTQPQPIIPSSPAISNQPRKLLPPPIPMIQLPPPTTSQSLNQPSQQQRSPTLNTKIESPSFIQPNPLPSPTSTNAYIQQPLPFANPRISASNIQYQQSFQPPPPPQSPQGVFGMYHYSQMPNFYQFVQPPQQPPQPQQQIPNPQGIPQIQLHNHHMHMGARQLQQINNLEQITVPGHQMPQMIQMQHPIPQMTQLKQQRPHINQLSTVTQIGVAIPPTQSTQPPQSQPPTISVQMVPPSSDLQNKNKKGIIQNQPLPQPIVSRKPLQSTTVPAPNNDSDNNDMKPPEPTYYNDKETGEYGVRCVCGEGHIDSLLVQCDMCDFWLHGLCVNVARETKGEPYFCPFCLKRKIRCKCGESMKYSVPIIQCTKCQMWVHKQCENLDFGINPENFVCSFCGGGTYDIKEVDFTDDDDDVCDEEILVDEEKRSNIINSIPDGNFKIMITEDLQKPEISFRPFVAKYFHRFAPYLFDRAHEFWRVFNETLCNILNCKRSVLLNALDTLATHLLYKPYVSSRSGRSSGRLTKGFSHSESITEFLEKNESWPRLEKQQTPVKIYCKDGRIHSPVALEEGAFIADLPGFLMHTDEVKAENGIPLSCLIVTDNDIIIDTEGTTFTFAPLIRRSFHFNCIVKLIRIKGEPRIGLFATRMKGALSEEKSRRGPAIQADGELFLPFDGEIPFPVNKIEWKDKKRGKGNFLNSKSSSSKSDDNKNEINQKSSSSSYISSSSNGISSRYTTRSSSRGGRRRSIDHSSLSNSQYNSSQNGRKSISNTNATSSYYSTSSNTNASSNSQFDSPMCLTLLSSFYDDSVPPMPFVILEDDDAVNRYKVRQEVKSKTRSSRGGRHRNND